MSIKFKYNEIEVSMNEETGLFSAEGNYRTFEWVDLKRKLDNAAKAKYNSFKAVLYNGYRGGTCKIVTVTRPQIGSKDLVWVVDDDKKRQTASIKNLYPVDKYDLIVSLLGKIAGHNDEIDKLSDSIAAIEHVEMPKPIDAEE